MTRDEKTVGKIADATKEIAKTTGKAIDATTKLGRFLDRVMGDLVTDAVGLLSDRLKYYRYEKLVLLAEKTETRLAEKGIKTTRAVPPKVALPLIEAATLEEDDDLHTLWANLLATGIDAEAEQIERKYVTTLAEMTGEDAHALRLMWDEWQKQHEQSPQLSYAKQGPAIRGAGEYGDVSVITLNRLGLITPSFIEFMTYEPGGHNRYGEYGPTREPVRAYGNLERIVITPFGEKFCHAVGL